MLQVFLVRAITFTVLISHAEPASQQMRSCQRSGTWLLMHSVGEARSHLRGFRNAFVPPHVCLRHRGERFGERGKPGAARSHLYLWGHLVRIGAGVLRDILMMFA